RNDKGRILRKRNANEGSKYTSDEIEVIKNAMRDIIMRNTDIQNVKTNPFKSQSYKDSLEL
ncbi:22935_t:CDS:2, partial [Dentiscutata erythropus]